MRDLASWRGDVSRVARRRLSEPDVDSETVQRHLDNLGSRSATVRARAANALIEVGEKALLLIGASSTTLLHTC